jgi:nicotinate-nucleotide pyrophosphorylase (carboxylating)
VKPTTIDSLVTGGLDPTEVVRTVKAALAEDLGPEGLDVTSAATVPSDQTDVAELVARADGVLAGIAVAIAVFELVDARVEVLTKVADGAEVRPGEVIATVSGPTRGLLTAERTALNLLCRMSGVATHTRAWVDAVAGTGVQVLDTRKTTPGLRSLEKYAVRAGGGANKRMGLYDVAMVKDNHARAAGGVAQAFARVRAAYPYLPVQVEVADLAEAVAAVEAGASFLLCDNMSPQRLREVVTAVGDRVELEATGNLTLATAKEYAETGVNYLSVGALTHSSPILDIALDLDGPGNGG